MINQEAKPMYIDQRWAINDKEHDLNLEMAARLLAACPGALEDLKTTKEIFDKTVELADMFHAHIHRNDPLPEEYSKYFKESSE